MKRLLSRAVPFLLLAFGIACQDAGPVDPLGTTAPISRVEVQPTTDTIVLRDVALPGDVVTLRATVVGFSGTVLANARVRWSTRDTGVVTVDSLGLVRAKAAGTARIIAEAGGKEARATVVVVPFTATVRITTSVTEANVGDTLRLAAAAVDEAGAPTPGVAFTWTSSNPAVATVDATTGLARFVAPGVVRFTATSATAGSATTGNVTVVERRYVASSSGYDHTCSVLSTGEAYCWGRGHEGQVGAAKLDTVCYDPEDAENRKKQCSVAPKRAETAVRFTRIAAGGQFSCGVATTQRAYCWGLDTLGQLGGGKLTATAVPSLVTSIVSFRDITAGGDHACGLTTVNTAFCWGSDVFGQLGNVGLLFTSSTPIAVDGELRFQQLSAGRLHTCGALVDGRVACWGSNFAGQVGSASVQQTALGPVVDAPQIVPLPVSASAAFAAQGRHSCALSTNGAAYCWGSNRHGELGTGARTTTDTAVTPPSQVVGGLVFAQLAGGFGFTCGVSAGNIYCWGRNDFGQTGNGPVSPTTVVLTPRQVATPVVFDPATGLTTPASVVFTSVTAGLRHACGQANDGALYCWGSDVMGALGSQQQQLVQPRPVRVSRPI